MKDKGLMDCTIGRYLDELRLTDEGWKVTNKTLIRTVSKPYSSGYVSGCGPGVVSLTNYVFNLGSD